MPNWNTAPPANQACSGYRLLRTPTAKPLQAHVVSDNLVGCNTHYVGNRTIPCESPDCQACESGHSWRWHGYLAVKIDETAEVILFEMTARASQVFSEYYQRHGTLRGCHFKATRLNGRSNGRVLIYAKPGDLAKLNLPKPPNVERLLCHIWNIPEPQVHLADTRTRPPFQHARVDASPSQPLADTVQLYARRPDAATPAATPPTKGNGTPK